MSFLVDTNVWLETLLGQRLAAEADLFFRQVPADQLAITDFALFSVAIRMTRERAEQQFLTFLNSVIATDKVAIVGLPPAELDGVLIFASRWGLDFDDAYHYAVAQRLDLAIVTYDAHFDRTDRGRKTPAQVMAETGSS